MTHCKDTNFQKNYSGSNPDQWSVKKDGVSIPADIQIVSGKIRVRINGSFLSTGNSFTIFDNNGNPVETYSLVDC